ncbi:MAG: hypothetical protein H6Q52_2724 [Deltaproteobacteria bacterium]|nr:hypothetical protein [Deltaproteobacteria bacterium]
MSLAKSILVGIILLFLIIPFNAANAQIRVHSSEGVAVIGGTSEDFEKASSKQKERDWHRVDGPGPGEQEGEYRQAVEQEGPQQQQEQVRQEEKVSKKVNKKVSNKGIECVTIPDHGAVFRMCKDKYGKTVSMEELGQAEGEYTRRMQ